MNRRGQLTLQAQLPSLHVQRWGFGIDYLKSIARIGIGAQAGTRRSQHAVRERVGQRRAISQATVRRRFVVVVTPKPV